MPKHYLSSDNVEESILLVAHNIMSNFNLKDWEVATYVERVLAGIIDDKTVAKYLPEKYKRRHGILQTCKKCGKNRIKNMSLHNSNSHPEMKK